MASMPRSFRFLLPVLLGLTILGAQVPLPPAAQVLKPLAGKVVDALLKPKMKVDHFTVGAFTVKEVDPTSDATPEKFEGTGVIDLPAPALRLKVEFKNLVLKGSAAEGTLEAPFAEGHHAEFQGWTYRLKKAVVSDKAAHLEGTAEIAALKVDVASLAFTPGGLQGTVAAGDVPLAEGTFEATLLKAEVTFGSGNPQLKGRLRVDLDEAVRSATTGEAVRWEVPAVAFDSQLLTGTGLVSDALGTDSAVRHKGLTWRLEKVAFGFERGRPKLGSPTRLQFPLNVFGRAANTGMPYLTGPAPTALFASVPPVGAPAFGRDRVANPLRTAKEVLLTFQGFSGTFPLPADTLVPSGLTNYRLKVEGGQVGLEKGAFQAASSRISGRLTFGTAFKEEVTFSDAPAAFDDGLYLASGKLASWVELGEYGISAPSPNVVCDFSDGASPEGVPPAWMGVYLTQYTFSLPKQLYVPFKKWDLPATVQGEKAWFEANGRFSGTVAVAFPKTLPLMLYIAPVWLDPFELTFVDGVLLKGPTVIGKVHDVNAPPLLDKFEADLTFKLTQKGLEQIQVTPNNILETDLVGVDIALESAVLNPTSWDFSGRFDFHAAGANLPSFNFEHMVLQAVGGGIDGDPGPLKLGMSGARWDEQQDHPNVDLWGFSYGLAEHGFGVLEDGRFFVGFGGEVAINPLLPSLYNRVVFTTAVGNPKKGTVELEKSYDLDQDLAGMGRVKASMGFRVDAAGDSVSDAYFLGEGNLLLNTGEAPYKLDAGLRFGRSYKGSSSFPYFYALGHLSSDNLAVPVAPDFELYGFLGGLAQNFKPDNIRETKDIKGTPDADLGFALIGGIDAGTTDKRTFHGSLDLYVAQNLTTKLHGDGWLFASRDEKPDNNHVWADINFTRKPNVLDATFGADISQGQGAMRYIGMVQLHLSPDRKFLHIGTKDSPVKAIMGGIGEGTGYFTADFNNGNTTFTAGIGMSMDTQRRSWGPLYGRAWLKANGDLVIELPATGGPRMRGTIDAVGGAEFGMEFSTFWDDYDITLFSGELRTNLAFQMPEKPHFSGVVTLHYSVLGGLFEGDASAHLDF